MSRLWTVCRSFLLWTAGILHFYPICTFLVLLGLLIDPRRNDRPQRWLFRNVLRLAGVRFRVQCAPGFDRLRTSIFVCNHVNLFDPFVVYSAIPQFVRGLELESHFQIPAYGWMARRFGNIPVPDGGGTAGYRLMTRRVKEALDAGTSLIIFPEGSRTLDGRVGEFGQGAFRLAAQFGYPVVPMSIVGSFEFNRKGSWLLHRSEIVVHLHDTIETRGIARTELPQFIQRVRQIVARPVDEHHRSH